MENIKVPKSVQKQLSNGETVIAKISSGAGDYYATSKRLLRFKSESNYQAIEYNSQVSVTLTERGIGWFFFRIFAILFGLISFGLGVIAFIGPTTHSSTTTMHWGGPFEVSLFTWNVGLGCIAAGLFFPHAYYQIKSPDLDEKELKNWQFQRRHWISANIDRFAKTIKEKANSSESD